MKARVEARLLGLLVVLLAAGCVSRLPAPADGGLYKERRLADLAVTIECAAADEVVLDVAESAIRVGLRRAACFGTLRRPLRVIVYRDAATLRRAVGKEHLAWLYAWATDRAVALTLPKGIGSERVWRTLVAHELAHVVHYQTAGIRAGHAGDDDPLWFREGLAQWASGEGAGLPSADVVRSRLTALHELDPLDPSRDDRIQNWRLLYSAGFHLFVALIEAKGEKGVRDLLRLMASGKSFRRAFTDTYRVTPRAHYERWIAG